MSRSQATYVYCLLRATGEPALAQAPAGLPGCGPLRVLEAWPGVWLLVADAPAQEYGEEALQRGLAELEWVSRQALPHEAVVEHALTLGTVVPLKLFTQFQTDARALAEMRGRREELEGILDVVAGSREWSLRLRADARDAQRARRDAARTAPAASGTDFLRRKQEEREAGRRFLEEARASAESLFEELSALSASVRRREPVQTAGSAARLLLDVALLVPIERTGDLHALVERRTAELEPAGLAVTLSGPWPAYHFVGGAP